MRCIVFTNDKGGVGKTTTVANLAVGLAMKGLKTLVVDMDPQADVTYTLLTERPPGVSGGYIPPTAHALFLGHYSLKQVILQVPRYSNLSLIPANSDLADASLRLARHPTRLKRLLLDLPHDTYQVILIDTGKGLDPLAINALAAADDVIIMVSPGKLEMDAIARMQEHVRLVRDEVLLKSEEPRVKGILLTLADPYLGHPRYLDAYSPAVSGPFTEHNHPQEQRPAESHWARPQHLRDCPKEQRRPGLSEIDPGTWLMSASSLTGLGEPNAIGKQALFQPPAPEPSEDRKINHER